MTRIRWQYLNFELIKGDVVDTPNKNREGNDLKEISLISAWKPKYYISIQSDLQTLLVWSACVFVPHIRFYFLFCLITMGEQSVG